MKRILCVLMSMLFMFALLFGCSENTIRGSVVRKSTYGNAELDIMPQKLLEKVQIGDTVRVMVGDFEAEMPFVDKLIEEQGKLQLFFDKEDWNINICTYNERFCEKYDIGVGERAKICKK